MNLILKNKSLKCCTCNEKIKTDNSVIADQFHSIEYDDQTQEDIQHMAIDNLLDRNEIITDLQIHHSYRIQHIQCHYIIQLENVFLINFFHRFSKSTTFQHQLPDIHKFILKNIPKKYQNSEFFYKFIELSFERIFKTYGILLTSGYEINPLMFIPEKFRTLKVCEIAIELFNMSSDDYEIIPKRFKSYFKLKEL